jgi:hypothetical protein
LDPLNADDACVDAKQDKGIDGIYVDDVSETIYLIQVKVKQKTNSSIGDTDIKEFVGTLEQFSSKSNVELLLESAANEQLKSSIVRNKLPEKLESGYKVEAIFCCNNSFNKDASDFVRNLSGKSYTFTLYDSNKISSEHVDYNIDGGIKKEFTFDSPDSEIISHESSTSIQAHIFLANALQVVKLDGIDDGSLFDTNVRQSLGMTKVNKEIIKSIKDKNEHKFFPLYHNGITILCENFSRLENNSLKIENYVVVNGAQSLTSLKSAKNNITDELKILVKIVSFSNDPELIRKITTNSNNQNAIKPRDMRSNHGIQQRLKTEIERMNYNNIVYEIKRGERHKKDSIVISNEDMGLILLAIDLAEPWNCHQKYKVMDELHSEIFGRPDVDAYKVISLYMAFSRINDVAQYFEDKSFGSYGLTRYFLAHAVSEIIKSEPKGKKVFSNFKQIYDSQNLEKFLDVFKKLASTTAIDFNAEVKTLNSENNKTFDYKSDLKNKNWCEKMIENLKSQYTKDVVRGKAESIEDLFKDFKEEIFEQVDTVKIDVKKNSPQKPKRRKKS